MGLFRFCRLNFGTSAATEVFHEEIKKLLSGVKGVINIHDDILIAAKSKTEHNYILKQTLQILKDNNVTLNKRKCIFGKAQINFFGLVFSEKGVLPDPEKVKSLQEADPPTTKSELKSFLGMVNFSSIFIKNYATLTASF